MTRGTRFSHVVTVSPCHLVILILATLANVGAAREPHPLAPPPPEAPVLPIKIIAPPGTRATFYPDHHRSIAYEVPAKVAVRPGYIYRFRLSNLPDNGAAAIYPTIEVIGTLRMPPICCPEHPAPVIITEEDIRRVLAGAYITKVVVLEHPDRAEPVATDRDQPLETVVEPSRNLLEEAWQIGRPLLVLRMGDSQATLPELHAKAIPGTMLLPNDTCLGLPAMPPCVPYRTFPVTDPTHGLRWYPEEECLKDGGDHPPHAGHDRDGMLRGLDPKDTLAEYIDGSGIRRIVPSNRVCICVPRYLVIRTEQAPSGYDVMIGPTHAHAALPQLVIRDRMPALTVEQLEGPELLRNPIRPQVVQDAEGPVIIDQWLSTGLIIADIGPNVVVGTSAPKPHVPELPLKLCKEVNKHCVEIGEVLTFTLTYTNPGGVPIRNVIISDSLTGRLEYIPASGKTDRPANFTTQENSAGSLILRWEIQGELPPGQSGVITFQAKVR